MPRSTNKHQFIEDEEARNETLRKGKKCLIKKMSELTKFGDVDACFVMYDKEGGPPTVWPSTAEAHRLIEKYYESKRQRVNAMQNYAVFLEKRVAEMKKEFEIQKEKYMRNLMMKNLYDVNAISEITCKETLSAMRDMLVREQKVMNALIKEKEASSSTSTSSKPNGV
ncbi:MADS-box transcription factor PHERES 2-like [Bidens hawaiensis]|uniref:MADS-box transcription factor PHERES 2-like n=1 Tax=Bidens hawaiensis TaxID=980011 RepID=UPI00404B92DA